MIEKLVSARPHMRRRASQYTTLDGHNAESDQIAWYWRTVAFAASWLILGGFLTLPANFDNDTEFRVSKFFLGIFSVALLTTGFSLTGLVCFAVRDWHFRAYGVFTPALSSCSLGLLTVFYCFLVNSRYAWNTAALLTTIAAALSIIIYCGLLFWVHWRLAVIKDTAQTQDHNRSTSYDSQAEFQRPTYYNNYLQNMYPTSRIGQPVASPIEPVPTEEEYIRQQMLMLLVNKPTDRAQSPNPTQDSFNRIDWEARDDSPASQYHQGPIEHAAPFNGYYAPQPQNPMPALQGPAWDGVWRRGEVPQGPLHPIFRDARTIGRSPSREERRRQIENGA